MSSPQPSEAAVEAMRRALPLEDFMLRDDEIAAALQAAYDADALRAQVLEEVQEALLTDGLENAVALGELSYANAIRVGLATLTMENDRGEER